MNCQKCNKELNKKDNYAVLKDKDNNTKIICLACFMNPKKRINDETI